MSLTLLDWRRRVSATYAAVRADPDPASAHAAWQAARNDLFASHPDSPLQADGRAGFESLPVAPYDPAYRFVCELQPADPQHLDIATGTDGVVPFDRIGLVTLPGIGSLDVWWLGSYGGGLFVPVRDPSPTTYGGGRYLIDTVKGADLGGHRDSGGLVIDLNFAYNPSCAYDPAWACPLAPPGNVVKVGLPVGERYVG